MSPGAETDLSSVYLAVNSAADYKRLCALDVVQDTLSVVFPAETAELTNRGVPSNLARCYDPLGLVSPVMLEGKLIYREICHQKLTRDAPLPDVYTN